MQKFQSAIFWTILVSETAHIFCCVLPAIVSALSILGSLGILSFMPASLLSFHEFMHQYEIPVLLASTGVLVLGWVLHFISARIDCHDTGCGHPPCTPKKQKTSLLLKGATILFLFNTTIYFTLHYHQGG